MCICIRHRRRAVLTNNAYSCIFLQIILTLLVHVHVHVDGHLQTAFEQVVGRWNVQLHMMQSEKFFQTFVFTPSLHNSNNFIEKDSISQMDFKKIPYTNNKRTLNEKNQKLPQKGSSSLLQCILNIHPNGTFTLLPDQQQQYDDYQSKYIMNSPAAVVHGYWTLLPNPYCVTDRQYDDLYMVSLPRVKIGKTDDRKISPRSLSSQRRSLLPWSRRSHAPPPIQVRAHAILEFRSRVWGRYSSQAIRNLRMKLLCTSRNHDHAMIEPRMTHGICTLVMEQGREELTLEEEKEIVDPMTFTKNIRKRKGNNEPIIAKNWVAGSFQAKANKSIIDQNISMTLINNEDYYDYYNWDE